MPIVAGLRRREGWSTHNATDRGASGEDGRNEGTSQPDHDQSCTARCPLGRHDTPIATGMYRFLSLFSYIYIPVYIPVYIYDGIGWFPSAPICDAPESGPVSRNFEFERIDLAITLVLANQPVTSESECARDQCQSAALTLPVNPSFLFLSRASRHFN